MMISPHLFFGPNAPGTRAVAARAEAPRERARADDPGCAARQRGNDDLRDYPDYARRLAALGLQIAPPRGLEESFELRAHLRRTRLAEVERRLADAARPAERGGSAAARLARADAVRADLRRPMNFAGAPAHRGGDRRSPSPHESRARAERARFRSALESGFARTRDEAVRIAMAGTYDFRGPRACYR
jgi:hypothetical protein